MTDLSRRSFLKTAAGALGAPQGPALPEARSTLSCNLELMFPRDLPHERRLEILASEGLKAYSFWGHRGKDLDLMGRTAERLGLACGSVSGTPRTGWSTGLAKTGAEAAFLADLEESAQAAARVGARNLVCFVGQVQKDIPWEVQERQVVEGLRRAGDLAEKYDVYVCLEPLHPVESPQMSVLSAREGFRIVAAVNHPRVKLDFDMYHLQLGEGNLINNPRKGLDPGWIRFVEIGDVPGRREPRTGEVNSPHIFRVLRELGYAGLVGLQHGTSSPRRTRCAPPSPPRGSEGNPRFRLTPPAPGPILKSVFNEI
jgi:hydroxypyruvate isomerase